MYHYEYVSRKEAAPCRRELIEIIKKVQNEVREDFTFQFTFVGSSKRERNMITCDPKTNKGFDFDVNIKVNNDEDYKPKEIRDILREAFNGVARDYGFSYCKDWTRVLTIKCEAHRQSHILYSCDLAIVRDRGSRQQCIRYNKRLKTYTWEFQTQSYRDLEKRADALKTGVHWNEVRKIYIQKKNSNTNPDKRSRSLYAETINECYKRHFGE